MYTYVQGCDLTGILDTWCDGLYDWSVGMEGYRIFKKDRQGRRGDDIILCVNDWLECLVLMGDFSYPNICWRDNTAGRKQSRRFLECIDNNFLLQVIKGL